MKQWVENYINRQKQAIDSINQDQVVRVARILEEAHLSGRQIFVFGNGGSAANASHFATDLGKSSSDALGKRFKILSLNDNVSWMTAISNDYAYEDVFQRQLENYAAPKDIAFTMSVSGNSPNLVKAISWAKENGLQTIALVGSKQGALADLADEVIIIDSQHYGRVEDAHMGVCHMLCYVFMENAESVAVSNEDLSEQLTVR
ncbi:MAG: Phosphoheptose isomerase 1 [Verrucomicrobia subdivision 3 bacterium]|nr:Phosphoheptose isomerase 1 [Limisphaerales bacterium]MCS1414830.1 Phosphoheptose isomerase 1 [Limisphaerales bacterium]